jgi:hypothetical protein
MEGTASCACGPKQQEPWPLLRRLEIWVTVSPDEKIHRCLWAGRRNDRVVVIRYKSPTRLLRHMWSSFGPYA